MIILLMIVALAHADVSVLSLMDFPSNGQLAPNTVYHLSNPVPLAGSSRLQLRGAMNSHLRCVQNDCFSISESASIDIANVVFEFLTDAGVLVRGAGNSFAGEGFDIILSNVTLRDWTRLDYLVHTNGANVKSLSIDSIGSPDAFVDSDRLLLVPDSTARLGAVKLARIFANGVYAPMVEVQSNANSANYPLVAKIEVVDSSFRVLQSSNDFRLFVLRGLNVTMRNVTMRHADLNRLLRLNTDNARSVRFNNCTFEQTLLELRDADNVTFLDTRLAYAHSSSAIFIQLVRSVSLNVNGLVAQRNANGPVPDNVFWIDRVEWNQPTPVVTVSLRNANVTDFSRFLGCQNGAFRFENLVIDNVDLRISGLVLLRTNLTNGLISRIRAVQLERVHLIDLSQMSNVTVRNVTLDRTAPGTVVLGTASNYSAVTIANVTVRYATLESLVRFTRQDSADGQTVDVSDLLLEHSSVEHGVSCGSRASRCNVTRFTARNVTVKYDLLALQGAPSSVRDCAFDGVDTDGQSLVLVSANFTASGLRFTNVTARYWLMHSTEWGNARQPMRVSLADVTVQNVSCRSGVFNAESSNGYRHNVTLSNWWLQNCSMSSSSSIALYFSELNQSRIALSNVTALDLPGGLLKIDRASVVALRSFNVSRLVGKVVQVQNTDNVTLDDLSVSSVALCAGDDAVTLTNAKNATVSRVVLSDTGLLGTSAPSCNNALSALSAVRVDSLSIVNSVFERHTGIRSALVIDNVDSLTIAGTRFDGIVRTDLAPGGALHIVSTAPNVTTVSLFDCVFRNNSAEEAAAIAAVLVNMLISGTRFFDNRAKRNGAIAVTQCCTSQLTVISSLFRNTSADDTLIRADVSNFTMIDSDVVGALLGSPSFATGNQLMLIRASVAARLSDVTIAGNRFISTDRPGPTAALSLSTGTTMAMSNVCICNNTLLPSNDAARATDALSVACFDHSMLIAQRDSGTAQVQASGNTSADCQNPFTAQWRTCPTTCVLRAPELQADPTTPVVTTSTATTTERITLAPVSDQPSTDSGGSVDANATSTTPLDGDGASVAAPGDDSNVGAIVGGVVGGLAALALLGACVWFFVLRPRQQQQSSSTASSSTGTTSTTKELTPMYSNQVGGAAEVGKDDMTSFRVSEYDRVSLADVSNAMSASDNVYQSTRILANRVVYDRQFNPPASEYESTSSPLGGGPPQSEYGAASFLTTGGKNKKPLIYVDKIEE
jgi:hypothetical protein